jgi:hypothetical protein
VNLDDDIADRHDEFARLHLEIVAAAASFVRMSIDGEQLVTLKTANSLVNRIRRLRRKDEPVEDTFDRFERRAQG